MPFLPSAIFMSELEINKFRRDSLWGEKNNRDKQQHIGGPSDKEFQPGKFPDHIIF